MSFLKNIREINRCYSVFRGEKMEPHGVAGSQCHYLLAVHDHPGIPQDSLADLLIFNKSSVARQLGAMEEKGLIRRERSPKDKRIFLVYPTEKGEALVPLIRQANHDFLEILSQSLTREELAALEELTQKVKEPAKEAVKHL